LADTYPGDLRPKRYLGVEFIILSSVAYPIAMKIGNEVRRAVRGAVWKFGDDGYDAEPTVWNGAADRRPAAKRRYDPDATCTAIAALTP
jgi:hypothetical protein